MRGIVIGAAALAAWSALPWWRVRRLEVGAWGVFSSTADPHATLERCRRAGVTFLDVMVNDASADRVEPVAFHIFDTDRLRRACAVWRAGGLPFGFTTWATPRRDWLEGLGAVGQLATECGARSVTLDLEEPWMALRGSPTATITATTAAAFASLRRTFRRRVGVTHIVYADPSIIGPALALADEAVPQCYATAKNAGTLRPGDLERTTWSRWSPYGKPIVMGAAAWNTAGAYGLGAVDAIRASMRAARELGATRVRFWRLDAIEAEEAAAIRETFV